MKWGHKQLTIFFLLLSVVLICTKSEADIVGYAYDPIENGGGARLLGMGKAFVAVSDDPNAIFVNPAGLSGLKYPEALGMYYTRFLDGYYYVTGGGVFPTKYGTFGLGYVGQGSGDLTATNDDEILGKFDYADNVVIVSYGTQLSQFYRLTDERFDGKIDIGGNLKFFSGGFSESVSAPNFSLNFDLGLKYRLYDWATLGIVKNNLLPTYLGGSKSWKGDSQEILSSPTKLGAAFKLNEGRNLVDVDMIIPSIAGYPLLFNIGTEYLLDSDFYLRAGLNEMVDAASGVYWGYSFGLGIEVSEFKLDYAYKPYYDIGENTVHYFSLSYVFNPPQFVLSDNEQDQDMLVSNNKEHETEQQDVGEEEKIDLNYVDGTYTYR